VNWRDLLPETGGTPAEWLAAFKSRATALKADVIEVADEVGAARMLAALAREAGWRRVAAHRGHLTRAACAGFPLPVSWTDDGLTAPDLESCDAGITECVALVAQTGSVLITAASSGGRALSVLPPHHVVLARRDQAVPDLLATYEAARVGHDGPRYVSLISGPSRTGDIERTLVLGAHGPRRLSIVVVG
jgi:L-lactate dehydrogenase complex protein LldG